MMVMLMMSMQVTVRKLVNAKYCDKFAHVVWKDGRVMHVNVTQELYRKYNQQLAILNDAILRRYVTLRHVYNGANRICVFAILQTINVR